MAVLTAAEIDSLALDRAQASATTDAPLSTAEKLRFYNDAYADVYEIAGGRIKRVASATAWTSAQTSTGIVAGILTDIQEVVAVFQTTTSGSTGGISDAPLRRVELERILWLRTAQGHGVYLTPKLFAISPMATTTAADVNKVQLDYYPSGAAVTGFYFPMHYIAQFTPLTALSTEVPDVNDAESRDIALLGAARIAQVIGRSDLVPGILADVSMKTAAALDRKMRSLMAGNQDA